MSLVACSEHASNCPIPAVVHWCTCSHTSLPQAWCGQQGGRQSVDACPAAGRSQLGSSGALGVERHASQQPLRQRPQHGGSASTAAAPQRHPAAPPWHGDCVLQGCAPPYSAAPMPAGIPADIVAAERAASSPEPFFFDSLGGLGGLTVRNLSGSGMASPRGVGAALAGSPRAGACNSSRRTGATLQGASRPPPPDYHRAPSGSASIDMGRSALLDAVASNPVCDTIAAAPRHPDTLRTAPQQVPSGGGSGNPPQPPQQQQQSFSTSLAGLGDVLGSRDAGFGFAATAAPRAPHLWSQQQPFPDFDGRSVHRSGLPQQLPTPSLAGW